MTLIQCLHRQNCQMKFRWNSFCMKFTWYYSWEFYMNSYSCEIHIKKSHVKFKWKQHFTWSYYEHYHVNCVHVNFTFIAPFSKIYMWISHAVPVSIITRTWLHWHFSNLNNCTEKQETVLLRILIIYMYQY